MSRTLIPSVLLILAICACLILPASCVSEQNQNQATPFLIESLHSKRSPSVSYLVAPSNLIAKATSDSQINLSWIDTNKGKYNEDGTLIERSLNSTSGFVKIGQVIKDITTYTDNKLSSGTTYYYRIRVWKKTSFSPYSSIVNATTYQTDTIPPTVSITSPANNTVYTTTQIVTITVSASDNVGVAKVEIYQDNILKITDNTFPYTYLWNITYLNNGTHKWTAKAYDTSGNNLTSNITNLIVNISVPDTTPPTGSIVINDNFSYTNSTSVVLTLSASDTSGVSSMCICDNVSCSLWEPYIISKMWMLPEGDGTKTVYVWYKDNVGNVNSVPYSDSITLDTTQYNSPCTELVVLNLTALNQNQAFTTCIKNISKETNRINKMEHTTMSYTLPKQVNTDYIFNETTYRLRYEGIDDSNYILFYYYCSNGTNNVYTYIPITALPINTNIGNLSGDCEQTTFINITQADVDTITFDFIEPTEPYWDILEYNFDINGSPACGNVSKSTTDLLLGFSYRLIVQYAPVTLQINVLIDHTAPDGTVTHYNLNKSQYYEIQDAIDYLYSTDNYKIGTYNVIDFQVARID